MKKSALAPKSFPHLPPVAGVRLAATNCGAKYEDRDDLLLVEMVAGTTAAGIFTRSATASAPVRWCRRQLQQSQPRALIVNAGNANTFTGALGEQHVEDMCGAVGTALGVSPQQVFVASTGVIGEPLPIDRIAHAVPGLADSLGDDRWAAAAAAIMTTDTFSKGASAATNIGGRAVTINGFAKGSGMIEPNMATMLAFIFTDAAIPAPVLQDLLSQANEPAFNSITVDSDTSTSDTCMIFATGAAGNTPPEDAGSSALEEFRRSLQALMADLAQQVVRDGEGASKFITIEVCGAGSDRDARTVAKAIANSPLVKTAIAGEDANWGRIVMAVGKSGVDVDPGRLGIAIGGIPVTGNGQRLPDYDETPVNEHLGGDEVLVRVDLGMGAGEATVWTCDLTHGYIEINADYRS